MTMNTSSSIFTASSSVATSQRQATTQKFRIFHQRRRPVRRALTELGTRTPNDRANNLKFAEELLTIDANSFMKKWDFNPLTMKPASTATTSKWEWKLVKPKIDQETINEKKQFEKNLFSLVSNNRKQLFLETVPVIDPVAEKEKSSIATEKSAVSEQTVSSTSTPADDKLPSPSESSDSKTEEVKCAKECDEIQLRLCAETSEKSATVIPAVSKSTSIPSVTASHVSRNNNSKQLSITDFTQHRKRLNTSVFSSKEEGNSVEPLSKRQRI